MDCTGDLNRFVCGERPAWQCLYRGSICTRARTIKDDGEYHRLCEHHRSVAIRNQKRWQQRRRAKKLVMSAVSPSMESAPSPVDSIWTDLDAEGSDPLSDDEWFLLTARFLDALPLGDAWQQQTSSPLKTQHQRRRHSHDVLPYV